MDAAALIIQVRLDAGLTQAELALRAGTSQPMIARYETGAASPTVSTLRRVLRAAGHELVLDSRPATLEENEGYPDSPSLAAIRAHQAAIRSAARKLDIRNVRIFAASQSARGDSPAQAELLVDFPVNKHGMLPLLALACKVEDLTGVATDVITTAMLTPEAAIRAHAVAVPL